MAESLPNVHVADPPPSDVSELLLTKACVPRFLPWLLHSGYALSYTFSGTVALFLLPAWRISPFLPSSLSLAQESSMSQPFIYQSEAAVSRVPQCLTRGFSCKQFWGPK